jgi:hypothetical protein
MITGAHYEQIDGKLEQVYLTFQSTNASTLLAVLKQRYGQPTSIQQRQYDIVRRMKE